MKQVPKRIFPREWVVATYRRIEERNPFRMTLAQAQEEWMRRMEDCPEGTKYEIEQRRED
jgi:hypothetical protein